MALFVCHDSYVLSRKMRQPFCVASYLPRVQKWVPRRSLLVDQGLSLSLLFHKYKAVRQLYFSNVLERLCLCDPFICVVLCGLWQHNLITPTYLRDTDILYPGISLLLLNFCHIFMTQHVFMYSTCGSMGKLWCFFLLPYYRWF